MELITRQRIALGAVFFQSGICFSTWASRIPDIKQAFGFDDYRLGILLLIKPLGSLLIGLPLAAWVVDRFGSRTTLGVAVTLYAISLSLVGSANSILMLGLSVLSFGVVSNLVNVALNAQALMLQQSYGRVIMASFHGLWSLAGFCGGALGSLAISQHLDVSTHFLLITALIITMLAISYSFLNSENLHQNKSSGFAFRMPGEHLLKLGAVAFCGLMCEGCMFDWSSVYFKEVVGAKAGMITAGFVAFMGMMATGRFISDFFTNRLGSYIVLRTSGILIFSGLITSVLFPYFITSILGFFLVGLGTSSVIPLTYSEVGKTKDMAPGKAISIVATIGYFGFLLGPPLIGFIAHALNLRASFTLVAIAGLCISIIITLDRRRQQALQGTMGE